MIPKVIHYCWFGKGEKSELAKKCIDSWKKYLPEYEIKEWNEDNFDVNINYYCKEAYEAKKYAFVTDYVRLYALYKEGGIYMDTDVEVLKPLDDFLKHPAFSSFENNNKVPTGLMASQKNNKWIKDLLDYYTDKHFIKKDGNFDTTTNVETITNISIKKYGLIPNNTYQELKKQVVFYPSDWFCPKDWQTGNIYLTENSHAIHHFSGSWLSKDEQFLKTKRQQLINKFGENKGIKKYKNYYRYYSLKIKIIKVIKNPTIILKKIRRKFKND